MHIFEIAEPFVSTELFLHQLIRTCLQIYQFWLFGKRNSFVCLQFIIGLGCYFGSIHYFHSTPQKCFIEMLNSVILHVSNAHILHLFRYHEHISWQKIRENKIIYNAALLFQIYASEYCVYSDIGFKFRTRQIISLEQHQEKHQNIFMSKNLMCCPKGKCGCQYFILLT
jgi:hypothetical protein